MVICDSSSLIHLAGIGRLGLLRELYGKRGVESDLVPDEEIPGLLQRRLGLVQPAQIAGDPALQPAQPHQMARLGDVLVQLRQQKRPRRGPKIVARGQSGAATSGQGDRKISKPQRGGRNFGREWVCCCRPSGA
jgi:hypothetical protein